MPDERSVHLPWYEASPDGLDELAQIKRTVDQLEEPPAVCIRDGSDGAPRRGALTSGQCRIPLSGMPYLSGS